MDTDKDEVGGLKPMPDVHARLTEHDRRLGELENVTRDLPAVHDRIGNLRNDFQELKRFVEGEIDKLESKIERDMDKMNQRVNTAQGSLIAGLVSLAVGAILLSVGFIIGGKWLGAGVLITRRWF